MNAFSTRFVLLLALLALGFVNSSRAQDTQPPTAVSAVFDNGNTEILVTFSEPMIEGPAEEPANYIVFNPSTGDFEGVASVTPENAARTQFRLHLYVPGTPGSSLFIFEVYDLALNPIQPNPTALPIQIGGDTTPPTVSASVSTSLLTQNNHDLVNVGLSVLASDNVTANPAISINVISDETLSAGDFTYVDGVLSVRAERDGAGDGRVYLILVTATDEAGNSTSTCTTVAVPHSNSEASIASVQAQADAAAANCGF